MQEGPIFFFPNSLTSVREPDRRVPHGPGHITILVLWLDASNFGTHTHIYIFIYIWYWYRYWHWQEREREREMNKNTQRF